MEQSEMNHSKSVDMSQTRASKLSKGAKGSKLNFLAPEETETVHTNRRVSNWNEKLNVTMPGKLKSEEEIALNDSQEKLRRKIVAEYEKTQEKLERIGRVQNNLASLEARKEETDQIKLARYQQKLELHDKKKQHQLHKLQENAKWLSSKIKNVREARMKADKERANQIATAFLERNQRTQDKTPPPNRNTHKLLITALDSDLSPVSSKYGRTANQFFPAVNDQKEKKDEEEINNLMARIDLRMKKAEDYAEYIRRERNSRSYHKEQKFETIQKNHEVLEKQREDQAIKTLLQTENKVEKYRENRLQSLQKSTVEVQKQRNWRFEAINSNLRALSQAAADKHKDLVDKVNQVTSQALSTIPKSTIDSKWEEAVEDNKKKLFEERERKNGRILNKHLNLRMNLDLSKHTMDKVVQMKILQHFMFKENSAIFSPQEFLPT
eukprot:TRINITY_DN7229_c0_g1_i1.p1 TRINITY_DN7229_c0_g1~~TRINITY_DN7229_c0_g1_i1.p1  ORF type:complete len:438 (-),score=95.40 TRINITY_DN7229_c0_g1_i1:118-1431(-)